MSNFLARLATRAIDPTAPVKPRPLSLFESATRAADDRRADSRPPTTGYEPVSSEVRPANAPPASRHLADDNRDATPNTHPVPNPSPKRHRLLPSSEAGPETADDEQPVARGYTSPPSIEGDIQAPGYVHPIDKKPLRRNSSLPSAEAGLGAVDNERPTVRGRTSPPSVEDGPQAIDRPHPAHRVLSPTAVEDSAKTRDHEHPRIRQALSSAIEKDEARKTLTLPSGEAAALLRRLLRESRLADPRHATAAPTVDPERTAPDWERPAREAPFAPQPSLSPLTPAPLLHGPPASVLAQLRAVLRPGPDEPSTRVLWDEAAPPAPVIHVHIGRVEVRAAPPPPRPVRQSRPAPALQTIDDYLRRRNGGKP